MRILLLHGLGQDAASFREATSAIRSVTPGCEFVLCEAPNEAVALSLLLGGSSGGGGLQWWNMSPSSLGAGWAHSLDHLKSVIEESGPFDGVIGFSQGAAAIAMLVAEAQLSGPSMKQSRWFHFACFIGGFLPNAPYMRERIDKAVRSSLFALPSWHAFGSDDFVIPSNKSEALANCFQHAVLQPFAGGHEMPQGDVAMQSFRRFIEKQFKNKE